MRALTVSVAIFINLVVFGMGGYLYLLLSQYWTRIMKEQESSTLSYDEQIYFYNRGYLPNDKNVSVTKIRIKHAIKENITFIKNSMPRFPNMQQKEFLTDTNRYYCRKNDSSEDCAKKTEEFKNKILSELRKVFTDESNILKVGLDNPYNVQYEGIRGNFMEKSPDDILCGLKKVRLNTLKRSDMPASNPLRNHFPKRGLFEKKSFNSCAIVASAGALKNSNIGNLIDSHDLVLRFNHAPTRGFEEDVGSKTTVRVLNSQVVSKSEFNFLRSKLYRNITLVAWDPSNYSSNIEKWLKNPDFNLFPNYVEYRKREPKSRFFILNPTSIWNLWDFLQSNSPSRLRKNPPSSGFLGLLTLLPFCDFVDMFEYVPSTRVSKRCHYFNPKEDVACTFGVWHPLAAEKLLTYHINSAEDIDVFQKGFVRIKGFNKIDC